MKCAVVSDIHIDFWIDLWPPKGDTKDYNVVLPVFEQFFDMYMAKPYGDADVLFIPGDICNDEYNQINFLKYIGTKFKEVYVCFGNHDLGVVGHTFGNGNPHSTSEERMASVIDAMKGTNVHVLEGEMQGDVFGCMGMCDCGHLTMFSTVESNIAKWKKWYDGKTWKYMTAEDGYTMNPSHIFAKYRKYLEEGVAKQPKVIMTHFCPIQMGVERIYDNNTTTCYFYFDAKQFLDELDHDTYWLCGHVHTAFKTDYVNAKGHTIHILCNPSGYPGESPSYTYGYKPESYVFEI